MCQYSLSIPSFFSFPPSIILRDAPINLSPFLGYGFHSSSSSSSSSLAAAAASTKPSLPPPSKIQAKKKGRRLLWYQEERGWLARQGFGGGRGGGRRGAPPPLFGRGFSRWHTYRRRKREEERQKFLAPTPPPPLLFFCVPNGKGKVVEVLPNFFAPQEREKGGKEGRTIFWKKNAGTKKYENKSRTIRLMQSDKMSLPPPLTRNIYRLFCTHNTRPFIAVSDVFSISLRFFWLGKGSEGCFC